MNHQQTAAYYTLGCKLNFAETSTIARQLSDEGFARVDFENGADVYVINTCSVTEQADKKCRNIVRRALGHNPEAFIAVVGCYAQLKPSTIAEIDGVDVVLGANEKFNIAEYIDPSRKHLETLIRNSHIKETKEFIPSWSAGDRTRSFLKIQDGCDYFCSFCTIPLARGRSRSGSVTQVIQNAREISAQGIKEIVLTGVNIGDFKNDQGERFIDVVKALDQEVSIHRLRISSIEPDLLSEEIINTVAASDRFMPHFHIPLQSGSDTLLKAMRRRYDTELYRSRIEYIRSVLPEACIGVDVIVGYPGETEDEFLKTVEFLKSLDVSYLHVFTYSERPNTTAIRSSEKVDMGIRQQRNKILRMLSLKKQRAFYEKYQGRTMRVLLEDNAIDGRMHGFTENYIKVSLPYDPKQGNQIIDVRLDKLNSDGVYECVSLEQEKILT
ncbi:MAG: tRNA (N(6)-L-threonylcarbamoyladenosine(37)-C(2))-methylthiotransferase MtaB [Flavobacteriales bacterium]|nr:tRNA (N(6)-L-threonylcarbamoyladenosine(37)-C(2))-methylthiotransferase MtaB [Flavobacteriales bacterium]